MLTQELRSELYQTIKNNDENRFNSIIDQLRKKIIEQIKETYSANKNTKKVIKPSTIDSKTPHDELDQSGEENEDSKFDVSNYSHEEDFFVDNSRKTIHHWISKYGNVSFSQVIENKLPFISIHLEDEFGVTPLHTASQEGNLKYIEYLVNEKKVDVRKKDQQGQTGLHLSCESGHIEIVEFFVELTRSSSNSSNEGNSSSSSVPTSFLSDLSDRGTPLHCATRGSYWSIVSLLIDAGADISRTDNSGFTPLEKGIANIMNDVEIFDDEHKHNLVDQIRSYFDKNTNQLRVELRKANKQIELLRKNEYERDSTFRDSLDKIQKLEQRVKELFQKNKEYLQQIENYVSKLNQKSFEYQSLQKEFETLQKESESQILLLAEQKSTIDQLNGSIQTLQYEKEELNEKNGNQLELEENQSKMEREISELKSTIKKLEDSMNVKDIILQNAINHSKESEDNLKIVKQKNQELEQQLSHFEENNNHLLEQIESFQQQQQQQQTNNNEEQISTEDSVLPKENLPAPEENESSDDQNIESDEEKDLSQPNNTNSSPLHPHPIFHSTTPLFPPPFSPLPPHSYTLERLNQIDSSLYSLRRFLQNSTQSLDQTANQLSLLTMDLMRNSTPSQYIPQYSQPFMNVPSHTPFHNPSPEWSWHQTNNATPSSSQYLYGQQYYSFNPSFYQPPQNPTQPSAPSNSHSTKPKARSRSHKSQSTQSTPKK